MWLLAEGAAEMIRIDEIWLATQPLDMCAGPSTALARVVKVFGAARPHCAYLRSGQRAATIMSLIQCAKLNGHDPYAYLKEVLERLTTRKASQIHELLPHNWQHTA